MTASNGYSCHLIEPIGNIPSAEAKVNRYEALKAEK